MWKNEPDVRHDDRPLGNEMTLVDVVLGTEVWNAHWCHRMPSESLLDDGLDVGQLVAIVEGREFIRANDMIDFFLCLGLDFGIQCHCEEKTGEGRYGLFIYCQSLHWIIVLCWYGRLRGKHAVSAPPV